MSASRHLRRTTALCGALSALIVGAPLAAQAQTAPAQEPETEVEEIVVTGSRIPRPNLEQPAPVATLTREAIQDAGATGLGEIVAELPGMSRTDTVRGNADFGGGEVTGFSFPNLRDLGATRTLTLVDGKRHVGAYTGTTAVDLNTIPSALVERVETSTGGASAIYGSDAVSGVVNVILRDDFEGLEASGQYGISQDGLGAYWNFNATLGANLEDGRGNATFSFLASSEDRVDAKDIPDFYAFPGTVANPANTGPNDGIPNFLWQRFVGSDWIDERGVVFDAYTGDVWGFDANGNPVRQPARTGTNSAAFGTFPGGYCDTCFFESDWHTVIPQTDRYGFVGTANYDLTPNIRLFIDAKYVTAEFVDLYQPSFRFFNAGWIEPDNAFLTPAIRALSPFALANEGLYLNRFTADAGRGNGRDSIIDRDTTRIVGGAKGEFDPGFADVNWELSYNYGQVKNLALTYGQLIPGNYQAATDAVIDPATGQIVCRATLDPSTAPAGMVPGMPCVPYNPFIAQNSQAAADYISHTSTVADTLTQKVFQAVFSFDTSRFLNLPGGAIGFAGGFERREEYSERINDSFSNTGLSINAAAPNAIGGYDVDEWFIETNLPLLADHPLAHRLSIDAAYRKADYSHSGEAEAWKVGFLYAPVRDITLRGTFGEAVRAPNITEAFLPESGNFYRVSDPCDPLNITADPDRAANCALDPDIPVVPFPSSTNASIPGTQGGNANLMPESSESFTLGVILQPRWIPGLAVTLDYYDIRIEDAIGQTTAQTIVNNCYDSPGGLSAQYCDLFTRDTDPTSPFFGNINFLRNSFVNLSALDAKGWDWEATYRTNVEQWTSRVSWLNWATGSLTGSLRGTYVDTLDFYEFQTRPDVVNVEAGELNDPKWRWTSRLTYAQGPVALTWEARYEGEQANYDLTPTTVNRAEATDVPWIDAVTYHDLIVTYSLTNGFAATKDIDLYFGVNNVFDEGIPWTTDFNNAQYEYLGRRFFAGFRARF